MSSRYESLTATVETAFPEYDFPPPEPATLLRRWLAGAGAAGVREPLSLALATVDHRGHPSARTITVSEVAADGLVFTTHSTSRKAREIAITGAAAGLFYWRETGQQISLSGPVVRLDDAVADRVWAARPVPLHAMSAASRQSEPVDDVAALRAEAGRLAQLGALPRPERFAVYRLEPLTVEFWAADPGRLHRRLRYERGAESWHTTRLQP